MGRRSYPVLRFLSGVASYSGGLGSDCISNVDNQGFAAGCQTRRKYNHLGRLSAKFVALAVLGTLFVMAILMRISQNVDAAVKRDTRNGDAHDKIGPVRAGKHDDDARNDDPTVRDEIVKAKGRGSA